MAFRQSYRGGPLLALGAMLGLWILARILLADYGGPFDYVDVVSSTPPHVQIEESPTFQTGKRGTSVPGQGLDGFDSPSAFVPPPSMRIAPPPAKPVMHAPDVAGRHSIQPDPSRQAGAPVGLAAGHQMLWMAALSKLPLLTGIGVVPEVTPIPAPFYPAGREPVRAGSRWSADGWLLLRRGGSAALATGAAPATYGASQVGAVLRYQIAPQSAHRPAAYLRVTGAIDGASQKEVAVGLSALPVARVPLRAAVELRASDQPGGQRVRPAAMVITEIQPINLPRGIRAEFYGQAGYVGGKDATAFADGQLRLDTRVADLGKGDIRAGAGAWGGSQKGASRIDVGPSATVGVPIGDSGSARLGLDWRVRVTGNARPGSGPALTLSAGF